MDLRWLLNFSHGSFFAYDFDLKNDLSLCRKRLLIYCLQFTRKTMGLHSAFCSRCGCWPSITLLLTIHWMKRPKPNNAHCPVSQCRQALLNPFKEKAYIDTYWKTLHWFVCWTVSRMTQKTTEPISTDLWWRMDLGPEQTTLTFGAGPDKGKGMNSEGTMRESEWKTWLADL